MTDEVMVPMKDSASRETAGQILRQRIANLQREVEGLQALATLLDGASPEVEQVVWRLLTHGPRYP